MSAADQVAWDGLKGLLVAHTARVVLVVASVAALAFAYHAGDVHRDAIDRSALYRERSAALQQQLVQVARQRASDSITASHATGVAVETRQKYATARAPVKLVSDTVVQVQRVTEHDTVTLSVDVPKEIPALIRRADATIIADSIASHGTQALLADVTRERDLWKQRAELAEAQLKTVRSPRFGIRTGFAMGVTVAAALFHLLK
jgi:hypothetical protein